MRFHPGGMRDSRTRIYLPVKRIVHQENVENSQSLIGNRQIQLLLHFPPAGIMLPPGSSILLDFGYAFHGGIRICSFSSQVKLRIQFGESVSEAIGPANQDHSLRDTEIDIPRIGMIDYGDTVFRFAKISNNSEKMVCCQNIIGVALEHDLEVVGSFESSDRRLNDIWMTAVRTVHLCMQDFIYDGAKRDRLVWMGDMHPEIKGILCAFADTSIIRRSLDFLTAVTPSGEVVNGISTYSCWFIISMWDYFMATGDRKFLEEKCSFIKQTMEKFYGFVSADGKECVGGRRFLDWPNEDNEQAKHAGIQALLYWMMCSGEKIFDVLGMDSGKIRQIRQVMANYAPDPAGRKAPAALQMITGLADRRDILEKDPFDDVSTFYGYYVLLAKETPAALELIRRYWGGMLDFGATSFWEDFDLKWTQDSFGIDQMPQAGKRDIHADFGNYCYKGLRHSLSHGWSCGPAPFLSERISGIRFLEPGGRKISVAPDPCGLEYVKITLPSSQGAISVEIDKNGKYDLSLPPGVEAVPARAGRQTNK